MALGWGGATWHQARQADPHQPNDRFHLPAFDAFVYVAMADDPGVFTVAPWGYRILAPWIVHATTGHRVERGYRRLALAGLALAAGGVFAFVRRRGIRLPWALAGAGLFAVSGPVAEVVRYRYLAEPVALPTMLAFVVALEAGAGAGWLGLVLLVAALAKETAFLLVPLVLLEAWPRIGSGRALLRTLVVAAPAMAATLVLRSWWAPHLGTGPGPSPVDLVGGVPLLLGHWREWWVPLLMGGVLPLAALGLFRSQARAYRARYGYLMALTLALPFGAGLYTGEDRVAGFFSGDVPRLLLYAIPFWLPVAYAAFGGRLSGPPPRAWSWPRGLDGLAGAAAVALVAALPLALDTYRRIDLSGTRDGPRVLVLCGESLDAAARLARGRPVVLGPDTHGFAWGHSEPTEMERLRWFLLDGWGPQAHYGIHDIVMRGSQASLLLPVLVPGDVEVGLEVAVSAPVRVALFANGTPVGRVGVEPGTPRASVRVRVPASALFRGDNTLSLVTRGASRLRLLGLEYRSSR